MIFTHRSRSCEQKHYQFKGSVPLDKVIVTDILDNPAKHMTHGLNYDCPLFALFYLQKVISFSLSFSPPQAFQLDRFDLDLSKTYIVCCTNVDEKKRWLQGFRSAQDKLDVKPESKSLRFPPSCRHPVTPLVQ